MISSYIKGNKSYKFHDSSGINGQNIFTVIVGKNGSGKSRLLNDIISQFVSFVEIGSISILSSRKQSTASKIELDFTEVPKKIIAVSTSPYDKFPIPRFYFSRQEKYENYAYLGIRDLRTSNFSKSFMSKIIGQLLYTRGTDFPQFRKIVDVLKYLGYSEEFHITFDIRMIDDQLRKVLRMDIGEVNTSDEIQAVGPKYSSSNFLKEGNDKFDLEKIVRLKRILNEIQDKHRNGRGIFQLFIDSNSIDSELALEDISFLIEAGIARLRDIGLKKISSGKIYNISEASSGEQCIFTIFVGISCNISDNSLILIDEPEISLHPEWQEKFITLLIDTFKDFKHCHFIIATHSPQLISKLATENCYILQMDSGELMNAKDFINNSIDFQLANIFNSPGFKNEYLSRIAISIISKVGKNKAFDNDDLENYLMLKTQVKFLQANDPVFKLYKLIEELKI
jgi:predicted ATPase